MPGARLLHLSDLHLTATGVDEDGVDARAALQQLLHDLRHVEGLDAVVVSGDLADDGSAAGYVTVLELLGAWAAARGCPLVCSTGNHDRREAFAQVLGSGHRAPDGRDAGRRLDPTGGCLAAVSDVGGLRLLTLDSLVPAGPRGQYWGELGASQLDRVRAELARPAPRGTVLVLHHPPVAASDRQRDVGLRDGAALAEVLAGSDVRAVLAGHLHHQLAGTLGGVPVWVTPGVLTRADLTAPPGFERAVLGASATLVDLPDGAPPLFQLLHARDPRAGEQAWLYDLATEAFTAGEG